MQCHAAIAIGGTRKQGTRELAFEFLGAVEAAFGLAQDVQGDGRFKLLLKQSQMRRRVVEFEKALVGLLKLD